MEQPVIQIVALDLGQFAIPFLAFSRQPVQF